MWELSTHEVSSGPYRLMWMALRKMGRLPNEYNKESRNEIELSLLTTLDLL
jgi:hypothetical protein